ncbi:amidophosphoribosyltransferase [Candidatus Pacearchaeota archaeon]|nr:amidophosphoribosyltransferase [Candidatus Pacearchaeota archaeon]
MCGVFGVSSNDFEAARITFFGLFALQHRGQESSGMVTSDGEKLYRHVGQGLVAHVYGENLLNNNLPGSMAIGHNRYSTSGGTDIKHAQPVIDKHENVALAHNGNLPITKKLTVFLEDNNIDPTGLNDSEKMQRAISYYVNSQSIPVEEAVAKSYSLFEGAFSTLVMDKNKLIAFRDKFGIRPLSIGKLNGGYIIASETCALDAVGAIYLRDVLPGEMVIFEPGEELKSVILEKGQQKLDIFEFIYFARLDSMLLGKNVWQVRFNIGVNLAKEHPRDADIVIEVPDSATPMAIGYSEQLGIPHRQGLIKNRYVHRTFITPDSHQKRQMISMKSNPIPSVLRGKRVIVVDDSIVKGNTAIDIIIT